MIRGDPGANCNIWRFEGCSWQRLTNVIFGSKLRHFQAHPTTGRGWLSACLLDSGGLYYLSEAERLKRFTYILLVVVLAQFLGLKGLCAPAAPATHDCCPPGQEMPAPSSSPLPDCCVATAARDQGGVAETRTGNQSVSATIQLTEHTLPRLAPPVHIPRRGWGSFSHPISPPISPLLQTCLLLI